MKKSEVAGLVVGARLFSVLPAVSTRRRFSLLSRQGAYFFPHMSMRRRMPLLIEAIKQRPLTFRKKGDQNDRKSQSAGRLWLSCFLE